MTASPSTHLIFLVGPPRTGSSLMARNVDDHEQAICLCESEVSRALYSPFYVRSHIQRMTAHGFATDDALALLSERRQEDVAALVGWYRDSLPFAEHLYGKRGVRIYGDKNPAITDVALVRTLADEFPLIYTVRDPRAIIRSIWREDVPATLKEERWDFFVNNLRAWAPYWHRPNLLVARYEDTVADPVGAMRRVYAHLGLNFSTRFMEQFERAHPCRFIWDSNVDLATGAVQAFDPGRIAVRDADLATAHLRRLDEDPIVAEYREAFGYARADRAREDRARADGIRAAA